MLKLAQRCSRGKIAALAASFPQITLKPERTRRLHCAYVFFCPRRQRGLAACKTLARKQNDSAALWAAGPTAPRRAEAADVHVPIILRRVPRAVETTFETSSEYEEYNRLDSDSF